MALSASTDYTLTARQICDYALRKINILAEGQSMTSAHASRALTELNILLKGWQKYPVIWHRLHGAATPVASTASITISSSVNPYRITACQFRNSSSIDLSMSEMTEDEYYELPNKSSTGTPTQWYFEPARSTNTLYIWPLLSSVSTETIRYTYQKRYDDVDDLANEVDVTQENLDVVAYNLAARLSDDYGRKGAHIDRVIQRAQLLYEDMADGGRPEMIRFVPGPR